MKVNVHSRETTVAGRVYAELNAAKERGDLLDSVELTGEEYAQFNSELGGEQESAFGLPLIVDGERVKSGMEQFMEAMAAAQAAEEAAETGPVLN